MSFRDLNLVSIVADDVPLTQAYNFYNFLCLHEKITWISIRTIENNTFAGFFFNSQGSKLSSFSILHHTLAKFLLYFCFCYNFASLLQALGGFRVEKLCIGTPPPY